MEENPMKPYRPKIVLQPVGSEVRPKLRVKNGKLVGPGGAPVLFPKGIEGPVVVMPASEFQKALDLINELDKLRW
jgi:hypothetical protein